MTFEPTGNAPFSIRTPEYLHLRDGAMTVFGGNQAWYRSWIRRLSGCGPTAASNLLWHLAFSRPRTCGALFDAKDRHSGEMLRLMNRVWHYVTPGIQGVEKPSTFVDGMLRYGQEHGVALRARELPVPAQADLRPTPNRALSFLSDAFRDDLPVAFLNLSNGRVHTLENWHWVTLIAVYPSLQCEMYDQGRRQNIDLSLWLPTTTGGGCFLAFEPDSSPILPEGAGA